MKKVKKWIKLRILFFTDLHIPNNTNSTSNADFRECLEFFQFVKKEIVENMIDIVIFGGDLFDDPKSITSSVLSFFSDEIATISQLANLILLVGNHDSIDNKIENKQKINLLTYLKHYDRISVIEEPQIITIHEEETQLLLVPYCKNINDILLDQNSKMISKYKKILFGHFDILDFKYIAVNKEGIEKVIGKIPSSKDLIEKYEFDLSFLGHIHEPCTFGDNDEVIFTGSCRNINFGNTTLEKYIYIIDTSDLTFKKIENPNVYYFKKFYSLNELKKYMVDNSKEVLSRTRIIYYYKEMDEINKLNKIKSYFDMIRLEKENINFKNSSNNSVDEDFFKKKYSVVTKNNLIPFIYEFTNLEEEKKEKYTKMFNLIERQQLK